MRYVACLAFLAITASAAPARGAEPDEGLQETFKSFVAVQNAHDLRAFKQDLEEAGDRTVTVLLPSAITFGLLLLAVYGAPRDAEYVYEQHIRYLDKEYREAKPDPFRA